MDLVKTAKTFASKIMKIELEEVESFKGFTSLFYECFEPCIEGNEVIKSLYEELKSFDGKPIDEKTNKDYCKLFNKMYLQQKILLINSELIFHLGSAEEKLIDD